jgi:hypothetical protein
MISSVSLGVWPPRKVLKTGGQSLHQPLQGSVGSQLPSCLFRMLVEPQNVKADGSLTMISVSYGKTFGMEKMTGCGTVIKQLRKQCLNI